VERVRLEPGDVILMASDGVMDAVDPAGLSECLVMNGRQPPEILAERVLEAAERCGDARYRDDMTAVCARVSLRREGVCA